MVDQRGNGCSKIVGIGCLVSGIVLIIVVIATTYVVHKQGGFKAIFRKVGASAMMHVCEKMIEAAPLTKAEKEEALKPLKEFTDKISAGKVSMEQIDRFMKNFGNGPLPHICIALIFEKKYIDGGGYPASKKAEAELTVNRFIHAMENHELDPEYRKKIYDIIMVKTGKKIDKTGKEILNRKEVGLRNDLSSKEVNKTLELMKEVADNAKIPSEKQPLHLGKLIQDAIDRAMETKKMETTEAPAPVAAPATPEK